MTVNGYKDCYAGCSDEEGCTAFSFGYVKENNCILYRNGPYTVGDGNRDYKCYIMPGKRIPLNLLIDAKIVCGKIYIYIYIYI